jgi:chemotaxis response regulator CheB
MVETPLLPTPGSAVVCDDDPVVRRIVTAVLQRAGFGPVVCTALAADAVRLAEQLRPDVVVLDLSLEHEFGLDAVPDLHRVSPSTRVVVFSSARHGKALARRSDVHAVIDKVSMASASELETVLRSLRTPQRS